jgi:hypothetical protein
MKIIQLCKTSAKNKEEMANYGVGQRPKRRTRRHSFATLMHGT